MLDGGRRAREGSEGVGHTLSLLGTVPCRDNWEAAGGGIPVGELYCISDAAAPRMRRAVAVVRTRDGRLLTPHLDRHQDLQIVLRDGGVPAARVRHLQAADGSFSHASLCLGLYGTARDAAVLAGRTWTTGAPHTQTHSAHARRHRRHHAPRPRRPNKGFNVRFRRAIAVLSTAPQSSVSVTVCSCRTRRPPPSAPHTQVPYQARLDIER